MRLSLIFFAITFFIIPKAQSQSDLTYQIEPGISFTQKFKNRWSFNGHSSIRYTFIEAGRENDTREVKFDYNETLLFATYEFWNNIKVSGGYGFQIDSFNDRLREHRITQQLGFAIYGLAGKRIANRLRLEQRMLRSGYTNRWRYRLGFDSPLNGRELNPGEMYIIFSNELLWSFNGREQNGQNRLYAAVGWFFSNQHKLETGLQYRTENISNDLGHTIWLTTSLYINKD